MMKGFVKKGLVLLALGVLIAGCAGPSQEKSMTSRDAGSINGVPMTLDPANQKLTIGDGSGGKAFKTLDGHSVEVVNGASTAAACVNDGTGNSKCWIRLYNRDPNYYMANAFVSIVRCDSCNTTNHTMDNFDASNIMNAACWDAAGNPKPIDGCTVHPPTTRAPVTNDGGATPMTTSTGAGIAYVSDTYIDEFPVAPHNPFGAPTWDVPGTKDARPDWMIGPKCGYESVAWDFGGTDLALFPFWADVKASWFQMKPLGANGVIGGGDDDPRYNFYWYTTIYLTLTDLVSVTTDSTWQKFYRPGSIYRSNVLAGYKPTWAKGTAGNVTADITRTGNVQAYFAVNVGIEAPDRMEAMNFGLQSDPNFDYYNWISILITYNPKVVTEWNPGTSWYLTKAGGTRYQAKATSLCVTQGTGCDENFNTDHALDLRFDPGATSIGGGAIDRGGYISTTAVNLAFDQSAFWTYFTYAEYYTYAANPGAWTTLTKIGPGPEGTIPKKWFGRGFYKIRCMDSNDATCIQQDGPDADPEFWLYQFIMHVPTTAVGLGTEIKVDTFSGFTYIEYNHTNVFDTGTLGDAVTNAGPMRANPDGAAFTVYDGSTLVIGGSNDHEYSNKKIRHRGPGMQYGTFQGWNVGVCIK